MLRKLEVLGTAAAITHTLPPLAPQVTSQVPNPMPTTQLNFLDFRTVLAVSIILLPRSAQKHSSYTQCVPPGSTGTSCWLLCARLHRSCRLSFRHCLYFLLPPSPKSQSLVLEPPSTSVWEIVESVEDFDLMVAETGHLTPVQDPTWVSPT